MCRIAGFWDFHEGAGYDTGNVLDKMRDTMTHGGPDDAGSYTDVCAGAWRSATGDFR